MAKRYGLAAKSSSYEHPQKPRATTTATPHTTAIEKLRKSGRNITRRFRRGGEPVE